ncbi:MAG: prolipoprotein diacylglyceryl transferase, partial [Planctomycetes bacterium]|nr:prolipoprotein diacylglyceryl transferase [Planctomycetota bacterium]
FARKVDPDSPATTAAQREVAKYEKLAKEEAKKYAAINKSLASYPSSEYPGQKITRSELASLADHASLPVHPAQLYATANAFLASFFLSMFLRWRRRHGMVFVAWLLTYPCTRVILEQIRTDNPLDTFGLTVSARGTPRGKGDVLIRFADGTETRVRAEVPIKETLADRYVSLIGLGLIFGVFLVVRAVKRRK